MGYNFDIDYTTEYTMSDRREDNRNRVKNLAILRIGLIADWNRYRTDFERHKSKQKQAIFQLLDSAINAVDRVMIEHETTQPFYDDPETTTGSSDIIATKLCMEHRRFNSLIAETTKTISMWDDQEKSVEKEYGIKSREYSYLYKDVIKSLKRLARQFDKVYKTDNVPERSRAKMYSL